MPLFLLWMIVTHILVKAIDEGLGYVKENAKAGTQGLRDKASQAVQDRKGDWRTGPKDGRFWAWLAGALAWGAGKTAKHGYGFAKAAAKGAREGRKEGWERAKKVRDDKKAKKDASRREWDDWLQAWDEEEEQRREGDEAGEAPEPPFWTADRIPDPAQPGDRVAPPLPIADPTVPPPFLPLPPKEEETEKVETERVVPKPRVTAEEFGPVRPPIAPRFGNEDPAGWLDSPEWTAEQVPNGPGNPTTALDPSDVVDAELVDDEPHHPLELTSGGPTTTGVIAMSDVTNLDTARYAMEQMRQILMGERAKLEDLVNQIAATVERLKHANAAAENLVNGLRAIDMDPETIGQAMAIIEALMVASTNAEAVATEGAKVFESVTNGVLAVNDTETGMNDRNKMLEEAHAATPHAAVREAYQPS